MRIVVLFYLWLLTASLSFAAEPMHCTPLALIAQDKQIILPGSDQPKTAVIYILHNKSIQSLWIDHPIARPSASAGWSSYLRAGNWSALVLNKKDFALRCAMIQPGKVVYLDCANTLDICTPNKVESTKPLEGSYWLAEDKNSESFIKAINKRGIQLKSP